MERGRVKKREKGKEPEKGENREKGTEEKEKGKEVEKETIKEKDKKGTGKEEKSKSKEWETEKEKEQLQGEEGKEKDNSAVAKPLLELPVRDRRLGPSLPLRPWPGVRARAPAVNVRPKPTREELGSSLGACYVWIEGDVPNFKPPIANPFSLAPCPHSHLRLTHPANRPQT